MQWIAAKVTFAADDEDRAVERIADLFQDLGTSGVVVDDPIWNRPKGGLRMQWPGRCSRR